MAGASERAYLANKHLGIGACQAAVLFQVFGFLVLALETAWVGLVLYEPKWVSQYLPYEFPVNLPTIAEGIPFVAVWGVIAYFSLKGRRRALLASLGYSVLCIALTIPPYVSQSVNATFYGPAFSTISLPSFGTILLFLVWAAVIGLDVKAYHSLSQAKIRFRHQGDG